MSNFERERLAPSFLDRTTPAQRRELFAQIREAAQQAQGAMLDTDEDGVALTLDGPEQFRVRFAVEDAAPYRLTNLSVEKIETPTFSHVNLGEEIDAVMAENNLTGVIFVKIDEETVIEKAYGAADPATGLENNVDTIFGIGSRPIDFTIAAIRLLAQQGKLSLNDPLSKFYPDAPPDRASMTIRHMLSGQSGLPDFPANENDWDADLGWIDRTEFERRTMDTPLLFAPGQGEAHSHWAFGVLAAIVERVSGQDYALFLRENFFEPAGMTRTGSYGEIRDFSVSDFAVGGGVRRGLPNIPPNWGPTSWLVMGSGGMYSTLGDLRKFYAHLTENGGLSDEHAAHFLQRSAQIDGSERGFELFSFHTEGRRSEVYVFLNRGGIGAIRQFVPGMVRLLDGRSS